MQTKLLHLLLPPAPDHLPGRVCSTFILRLYVYHSVRHDLYRQINLQFDILLPALFHKGTKLLFRSEPCMTGMIKTVPSDPVIGHQKEFVHMFLLVRAAPALILRMHRLHLPVILFLYGRSCKVHIF